MSEFFVDTSYKRKYTVVSATKDRVILRPLSDDPISSYWMEFISGYISEPLPADTVPTLHITQIPAEVITVDAYVEYVVEYPLVEVHYGSITIDVSDRVSVNHPNPETPGLYALDFMVSAAGSEPTSIWRSWLSIEEPPLLRRVITPWNRENKIIANFNRLVIEPQFTEAMYEAGVPIYNFQQANSNVAVGKFAIQTYLHARAFVKSGYVFISGPRLPVGARISVNGMERTIRGCVVSSKFSEGVVYSKGDVVSYCGSDYYAVMDIPLVERNGTNASVLPTATYTSNGVMHQCWERGMYYIVDMLTADDGEHTLDYIWSLVDINGYLFEMDLLRAIRIGTYWGCYNSKYFYDYAPGDLVSVIDDNVISLYQRNGTDLDSRGMDEAYKPGHYRNPNWTLVYSASQDTELTNPAIRPYTNATNAVVCKTYSAREESFRLYADMVSIPSEMVNLLGAKYSVLLWAILYRTRETFPGIRAAMNALGFDIPDLHRAKPSVVYSDDKNERLSTIYDEIDALKAISKSVAVDKVWNIDDGPKPPEREDDSEIPWVAYNKNGDSIMEYKPKLGTWQVCYRFKHIGSDRNPSEYDYTVNNRYYRAELNLLDRLSKDGALDFGDGIQWVDQDYYQRVSLALTQLLSYEVPVYIYMRLKIRLATRGEFSMYGASNGALMMQAWGGFVGLKVFPGKMFNMATGAIDYYYPEVLYSYEYPGSDSSDEDWTYYPYNRPISDYRPYMYYGFNKPVYIRLRYETKDMYRVKGVWTSRYTIGCLGSQSSQGTDDYNDEDKSGFKDAIYMDALPGNDSHSPDMYLCKGIVGCTVMLESNRIEVSAECLQWNYKFDSDTWSMDEVLPFADWKPLEGVTVQGYWNGSVTDLLNRVSSYKTPDSGDYTFRKITDTCIVIGGGVPDTIYLRDVYGALICTIHIPYVDNMVLDGDSADYLVKLEFSTVD